MISYVLIALLSVLIAVAAVTDLLTMTIPNWLSAVLMALFVVFVPLSHLGWPAILWHVALAAIVLVVAFGCFAFGWMGGGDAKFATALCLWFGLENAPTFLIITALAGGAFTLAILQFRNMPLPGFMMRQAWIERLHDRKTGVPYGVALSFAALVTLSGAPFLHMMQ